LTIFVDMILVAFSFSPIGKKKELNLCDCVILHTQHTFIHSSFDVLCTAQGLKSVARCFYNYNKFYDWSPGLNVINNSLGSKFFLKVIFTLYKRIPVSVLSDC